MMNPNNLPIELTDLLNDMMRDLQAGMQPTELLAKAGYTTQEAAGLVSELNLATNPNLDDCSTRKLLVLLLMAAVAHNKKQQLLQALVAAPAAAATVCLLVAGSPVEVAVLPFIAAALPVFVYHMHRNNPEALRAMGRRTKRFFGRLNPFRKSQVLNLSPAMS